MATAAISEVSARDAAALGITITPLTINIGAEISGIDLEAPLSADQWASIRTAWLRHKVIFFRDQDISHEAHVRLAAHFGELEGHPVLPSIKGYPEILRITGSEGTKITPETYPAFQAFNKWHTDVTFREKPSIGSVLIARQIPRVGGDTIWADAGAAYRGLPQAVKDRIEHLEAEHDIVRSFGPRVTDEKRAEIARDFPPARHPVVRTHPETGEKILYVNYTFTTRIVGLPEDESASLLRLLQDRIKVPEYQVRFRWSPGAIAIWDNRSTQHYAVGDYWPTPRVMERVTVAGDVVTQ
jgi:taurine dioxygenase